MIVVALVLRVLAVARVAVMGMVVAVAVEIGEGGFTQQQRIHRRRR